MEPPERSFPSPEFSDEETDIIVEDARWNHYVPNLHRLIRRILTVAPSAGCTAEPGTIVLSSDRAVKRLNFRHRGRNKPTNVLTFESVPGLSGGDIVLALETVCREASAAKRAPQAHLAHLIVHGLLHLDGYDHHHPGEARQMEQQEAWILSRAGFPNPWKLRMHTEARP